MIQSLPVIKKAPEICFFGAFSLILIIVRLQD